jgi:hypothetical protein
MEQQIKQLLLSDDISNRKQGWLFTKSVLEIKSIKDRLEYCVDVYMEYLCGEPMIYFDKQSQRWQLHLMCAICIIKFQISTKTFKAYNIFFIDNRNYYTRLKDNDGLLESEQQLRDLIREQVVLQIRCKTK